MVTHPEQTSTLEPNAYTTPNTDKEGTHKNDIDYLSSGAATRWGPHGEENALDISASR